MSATAVLDAPLLHAAGPPEVDEPPLAGAVAVLVDGSVSAIAAAAWAGRLARDKQATILVIALVSASADGDDVQAVLARVQPALDRAGRPCTVRVCVRPGGANAHRRTARAARRLRQLLPPAACILVCPEGAGDVVRRLAVDRPVDLLVVPDVRCLPDATAATGTGEGSARPARPSPPAGTKHHAKAPEQGAGPTGVLA
jgi:hypothetical protein